MCNISIEENFNVIWNAIWTEVVEFWLTIVEENFFLLIRKSAKKMQKSELR